MTLVEAATYSGLSANTLRAQIKNGVLPASLIGKTYVVSRDALDSYVRDHKGKRGKASPSYGRERGKGVSE